MDQNREIRAMILASLPYPPLPVEAKRLEDDNKLGDVVVTTSHDILSHLLEAICVQGNASIHKNRQERQLGRVRHVQSTSVLAPKQNFKYTEQRPKNLY